MCRYLHNLQVMKMATQVQMMKRLPLRRLHELQAGSAQDPRAMFPAVVGTWKGLPAMHKALPVHGSGCAPRGWLGSSAQLRHGLQVRSPALVRTPAHGCRHLHFRETLLQQPRTQAQQED